MKEIIKRLSLPSPSFFKKLRNFGAGLAGFGSALLALNVEGSKLLDIIRPFAPEFITAGAVIVLVSQLTVKPEIPNKKL